MMDRKAVPIHVQKFIKVRLVVYTVAQLCTEKPSIVENTAKVKPPESTSCSDLSLSICSSVGTS